jgi:hypothetical protein
MKDFKRKQDESQLDQAEVVSPSIDYAEWFAGSLKGNHKLRAHHFSAIQAYFKNNGLNEQESKANFDSMLKKFGY